MSDVNKFFEKVEGDAALNERFTSLETNSDVLAFANELGFSFTEDEYEKALEDRLNLDKLSGGAAMGSGPTTCPFSSSSR